MNDDWACRSCGGGFFGARPESGLCPGCEQCSPAAGHADRRAQPRSAGSRRPRGRRARVPLRAGPRLVLISRPAVPADSC
jgi:hypothetical protein